MKNKIKNINGFTLIELLVVVVIIGILFTVALPRYQLAADKATFATYQQLAKTIKRAVDDYYFANNKEYPISFDQIDVNFGSSYQHTTYQSKESCVIFKNDYCCLGKRVVGNQSANVVCGKNDYSFGYVLNLLQGADERCIAANGNDRAQRLCKHLTNNNWLSNTNLITPYGHDSNNGKQYSYYWMPK